MRQALERPDDRLFCRRRRQLQLVVYNRDNVAFVDADAADAGTAHGTCDLDRADGAAGILHRLDHGFDVLARAYGEQRGDSLRHRARPDDV